jgi:hypothetical protein
LKIPHHLSSSSAEIVAATLKMDEIAKIFWKKKIHGAISFFDKVEVKLIWRCGWTTNAFQSF